MSYLGPKIWDLVPKELKELSSLSAFKKAIKKWKPQIALVDYVKNTFKILVSFDTFSDILDLFSFYVLVLINPILFLYMLRYFTELFLLFIVELN